MRPNLLCRERLERIHSILKRAAGEPVTVREFARRYGVWKWELEQAATHSWIEINVNKPVTGRPSPEARIKEHSEKHSAKLPPFRRQMETMISCRHFFFAMASTNAKKHGGGYFFHMQTYTDAYLKSFPNARKRHAATSSMTRLMKHPDVKAARALFYSKINLEIPLTEFMPPTRQAIRRRLLEAGSMFANRMRP